MTNLKPLVAITEKKRTIGVEFRYLQEFLICERMRELWSSKHVPQAQPHQISYKPQHYYFSNLSLLFLSSFHFIFVGRLKRNSSFFFFSFFFSITLSLLNSTLLLLKMAVTLTIHALGATTPPKLGFQCSPKFTTFSPDKCLRRRRSRFPTRLLAVLDEKVSFTEEENSLIEALIGIQGRGRDASPNQLTVCLFDYNSLFFFFFFNIHIIYLHLWWTQTGSGASGWGSRRFTRCGWSGSYLSSPQPVYMYIRSELMHFLKIFFIYSLFIVLNKKWQTSSSLIEGRWQLMFTTRPGSASPIQVRVLNQWIYVIFSTFLWILVLLKNKYCSAYGCLAGKCLW